jgi:putative oxidoreductase
MSDTPGIIVLVGRLLFALNFVVVAGLGTHVAKSKMMEGYAQQANFPFPAIAGWPTGLWLTVGGLSVGLGIWPDIGALMLIAFLAIAAAFFHRFWELEDEMQKQTQGLFFWRNVFTIGALLVFFGTFVALGDELRYAVTTALLDF